MNVNNSTTYDTEHFADAGPVETFDWERDEQPALAVVNAVAAITQREPTELDPLAATVDTDALRELFDGAGSTARASGYVHFEYEGCRVFLTADGELLARSSED